MAVRKEQVPGFKCVGCKLECKGCEFNGCKAYCPCCAGDCCTPFYIPFYRTDYFYPPQLDMKEAVQERGYKGVRKLALFKMERASAYRVDPMRAWFCG